MCVMRGLNSKSVSHLFLHCPMADILCNILFGIFGECWVCPAIIDFQTSKFCGIELGVWPLFGVTLMIFLEEFLSQTC